MQCREVRRLRLLLMSGILVGCMVRAVCDGRVGRVGLLRLTKRLAYLLLR